MGPESGKLNPYESYPPTPIGLPPVLPPPVPPPPELTTPPVVPAEPADACPVDGLDGVLATPLDWNPLDAKFPPPVAPASDVLTVVFVATVTPANCNSDITESVPSNTLPNLNLSGVVAPPSCDVTYTLEYDGSGVPTGTCAGCGIS